MNFIVWVILGALLGFGAAIIAKAAPKAIAITVGIGIFGALLGGCVLSPLFGLGSFHRDDFNIPALFVSLMAAIMTLVILILAKEETKFRRRTRYRHATHPSRQ